MRPSLQPSEAASPASLSNALLPEPAYLLLAKIQVFPGFLSAFQCSSTPLAPHTPWLTHKPGFTPGRRVLLLPGNLLSPLASAAQLCFPKGSAPCSQPGTSALKRPVSAKGSAASELAGGRLGSAGAPGSAVAPGSGAVGLCRRDALTAQPSLSDFAGTLTLSLWMCTRCWTHRPSKSFGSLSTSC